MQTVNFLVALNQRLQEEIRYVIRMEPGVQTPTRRWSAPRAPAAIRPGCWSSSPAASASPPASSPAT